MPLHRLFRQDLRLELELNFVKKLRQGNSTKVRKNANLYIVLARRTDSDAAVK